jgi:hypothetical protein
MEHMKKKVRKSSPVTHVPGMVKTKVTLEAGETKTVSLQLGQEMVVHRLETQQDGPVLIRIQKQTSSSPVRNVINQAQETFQTYVDKELPEHLAMLVKEERTEWEATNQQLSQTAESGDDEAFFLFSLVILDSFSPNALFDVSSPGEPRSTRTIDTSAIKPKGANFGKPTQFTTTRRIRP